MANLPQNPVWETGVYQLEVTDPVQGGVNGITNVPLIQLVNRTAYLKAQTDLIPEIQDNLSSTSEAVDDAFNEIRLIRGAGAVIKHAVVTARHSSANVPNFITFAQGAGTAGSPHVYTVHASASEPLVVTASGGFRTNSPVLFYMRFVNNIVLNLTSNVEQLIVASWNETTNEASVFLTNNNGYTIGYQFPTAPAQGQRFYNLRNERMYSFGSGGWAEVNQVVLASSIPNSGVAAQQVALAPTIGIGIKDLYGRTTVPAGTIHAFAGAVAKIPNGYLLSDGAAISRTVYADLFAAIGTTYGAGNGTTTFNIPDLRGEFIRGLDNLRGIDTLRALGSAQGQAIQSHDHNIYRGNNTPVALNSTADSTMGPNAGDLLITTAATGGTETRPRNVAMNFIIKF